MTSHQTLVRACRRMDQAMHHLGIPIHNRYAVTPDEALRRGCQHLDQAMRIVYGAQADNIIVLTDRRRRGDSIFYNL